MDIVYSSILFILWNCWILTMQQVVVRSELGKVWGASGHALGNKTACGWSEFHQLSVNIDQWEQGQVWIIASLVTIKMLSDMWNLTVRRPCVVKLRDVYYSRSWSMIEVCELIWFTRLADNMQAMSTTNRCTFNWWQYSTQHRLDVQKDSTLFWMLWAFHIWGLWLAPALHLALSLVHSGDGR